MRRYNEEEHLSVLDTARGRRSNGPKQLLPVAGDRGRKKWNLFRRDLALLRGKSSQKDAFAFEMAIPTGTLF